ncbi:DNA-protecting protein DprA [Tissierella creatinini]|nr:DNA-protecting protein DprA [Tissierella creatinini]TJX60088.1 DNA-protecting protein DprA [Soehngenia saccharolytica]
MWLRLIKGLGPILEKRLLGYFGSPQEVYNAEKIDLINVDGIGQALAKNIISLRSLDKAYHILEECQEKNIKLLTYDDPLYPTIAKDYNYAPSLLYYRGNIRPNSEGVAIVGSRRCSTYGKEISLNVGAFLAQNNIPVISGMAKGIDSYAHIACVKNGGYTIAFLGNGVDICYPLEHRDLMEAIIGKGAVISEYPPGTKSKPEYFPKRNGLISSWSKKVLVVEASEKSGALITADFAKSQGKEVYVPPHEINSNSGKGSNKLLLEGAKLYLEPSQLLFDKVSIRTPSNSINSPRNPKESISPLKSVSKEVKSIKTTLFTPLEERIIDTLKNKAMTIEEISIKANISQAELIELLSVMELDGKVKAFAGGRYMASAPVT